MIVDFALWQVLPEVNLKDLYEGLIDLDLEKASKAPQLPFGHMPSLRNGCYYWLATAAGYMGKGNQCTHPGYSKAAVRAAFPGGKDDILSDSCQDAMHNEVIPDAEDVAALCSTPTAAPASGGGD